MNDQDKAKILLRAMTDVDDQYLRDAANYAVQGKRIRRQKVLRFRRTVSVLTAVAALVVVGVISSRVSGVRLFQDQESGGTSAGAPAVAMGTEDSTGENAVGSSADQSGVDTGGLNASESNGLAAAESAEEANGTDAAIGNPWQEAESMAAAADITGFDLKAPAAEAPYDHEIIEVMGTTMIEVSYTTEDGTDTGYSVRKAEGAEDISGDYNEYADVVTETVESDGAEGTVTVTLKGNAAEDLWYTATWTAGDYTYAIEAQNHPMNRASIVEKVKEIQ